MSVLEHLLQAVVEDPLVEDRWSVLADWLEEHDDPERAELLRLHRKLLATCCEPDTHPRRTGWQGRVVDLLGQGVRPCVPQRTAELAAGVEMMFSFIPPGRFLMGSPEDEPGRGFWEGIGETRHPVTLDRGFWLGVRPVTRLQWRRATDSKPRFRGGRDDYPAAEVSWEDCERFCLRLGGGDGTAVPAADGGGVGVLLPGRDHHPVLPRRHDLRGPGQLRPPLLFRR